MFTIIGGDGKEYGPVPASQVRAWMAGGRADLNTKARRLGEEDWRPLSEFSEFSDGAATPPPLPTEPARPAASMDARALADELIARAGKLDLKSCLSRGWDLWLENLGRLVLAYLVLIVVTAPLGLVAFHQIPVLSLLLSGVFMAGLFRYALKLLHGQIPSVADLFAGFREAFGPLVVASIVIVILVTLGCFCFILPGIYLAIAWAFTYPLILEKKLGFWQAMSVSRRVITRSWWRMFLLVIIGALLSLLGLAALIIGVFLTLPIAICMQACAYEALCNPPAKT